MIILDTNIVAALMANGAEVDPWLATVPRHELYTTVMTRAEIRYSLARLPVGKRRASLTKRADALFSESDERLLTFDAKAADRYGELFAARQGAGRSISVPTPSSPALRGFIAPLLPREILVTSMIAVSKS